MKPFLSMILMTTVVAVPTITLAIPKIPSLVISQQKIKEDIPQTIQLAFPEFVIVSLKSGNRTTGNFIDLNNRSLIIAFKGYTTGINLSEIKSVEFKSNVLIPSNETVICRQSNQNCRQVAFNQENNENEETLIDIPLTNLSLFRGAKTALLSIPNNPEEENPIIFNDKNIHIINFIEMDESGQLMTIKLVPVDR